MPEFRSNYQIEPAPGGQAFREQLVNMVKERRKVSEQYHATFYQKLPRYYDIWRNQYSKISSPTKNNIQLPLLYSTIQSDIARKIATHFSQWPVVGFDGFGPDDEPIARKNEALINAQLRDADVVEKEYKTFLCADLYGTAISQIMWDHKEETRQRTQREQLQGSDATIMRQVRERVVTFDGPNYRNIDLLDFYPQPGYRKINGNDGMKWCIVRYYMELDELRFMASERGGGVFSADELERLVDESASAKYRSHEAEYRRGDGRNALDSLPRHDRYSRPVEIIEMWGQIPSELSEPFGTTNVVITVANQDYLLRARGNPMGHLQKPFLSYSPAPDPEYFFAPGKTELAFHLQVAANRFMNHQLDAADLLVNPMWIYNRDARLNVRKLYARPGGAYGVDGDPRAAIAPVPLDFSTMQAGSAQVSELWRFMQLGSGVTEASAIGTDAGGDRQTAREVLARREAAGTRLMLESVLYDQRYLEPLANTFASLNTQFLDVPREILILGESAQTDPITGEPITNTRETIHGDELVDHYSARANGTTLSLSRETQKANDMQMIQILAGAGEQLAGAFNMVAFLRQMLTNLGYKNVNEILQNPPQGLGEIIQSQGVQNQGDLEGQLGALMGGAGASGPSSGVQAL